MSAVREGVRGPPGVDGHQEPRGERRRHGPPRLRQHHQPQSVALRGLVCSGSSSFIDVRDLIWVYLLSVSFFFFMCILQSFLLCVCLCSLVLQYLWFCLLSFLYLISASFSMHVSDMFPSTYLYYLQISLYLYLLILYWGSV